MDTGFRLHNLEQWFEGGTGEIVASFRNEFAVPRQPMTRARKIVCGVLTQDSALMKRLSAAAADIAILRPLSPRIPVGSTPQVWIVDLRSKEAATLLEQRQDMTPPPTIVACGVPGSAPWREALRLDLHAVVDVEQSPSDWIATLRGAAERTAMLEELAELRSSARSDPTFRATSGSPSLPPSPPLLPFPAGLRSYNDVGTTLQSLVEGVAQWTHTARAGLFSRSPQQPVRFTLRAALRPLAGAESWTAAKDDLVPQWLARSLQFVTKSNLGQIANRSVRAALSQALEDWGAEVIIPLQLRSDLIGWLFLGGRITGRPFDDDSLVALVPIADHAATVLDNVLLYEAATWQRSLVETVLQAMPTGIVVVDAKGIVRKCNEAAAGILACSPAQVFDQPVETLSSPLADLLRTALAGDVPKEPVEWTESGSRRQLSAVARLLTDGHSTLGAVAFICDLTVERLLAGKQEQVERAAFWTELAAAMSHEVRNPLVAIKTFAQLLPERYLDADFRNEFAQTVQAEIGRLENIIEQIHQFAHPPPLVWAAVSIPRIIQKAVETVQSGVEAAGIWVETSIADDIPSVEGDEHALTQCIAHLITNAAEALKDRVNPKVVVSARALMEGEQTAGVLIAVQDNGPGIRPDIRSKVFSPFCTTKARGLGLGLPIAQRIAVDHGGQLDIETSDRGTCVFIRLPATTRTSSRKRTLSSQDQA